MTPRRVIVLLLLFTLLIVTCILIGVSVSTIPYNNIALVQDEINPKIWEKVYGSGRHFIGVGRRFHTFPLNLQLIDFSWFTRSDSYGDDFYDASELRGRTYDGLAVTVAVTVFSRIRKNESRDLYLELCYSSSMDSASLIGGEFSCADKANSLAAMHLRAILVNVIALTETEVFFRDRARLSEDMASAAVVALDPLHMDVELFSLRQFVFDAAVDDAITAKIVTAQQLLTTQFDAETRMVRADEQVLVQHADTEIAWRLSAAEAAKSVLEAGATAEAYVLRAQYEANATKTMRDAVFRRGDDEAELALANDAVLTRGYYADVLAETSNTRLLVGQMSASLHAVLPACACLASCPPSGWCEVSTAACRGSDGKLASYFEPDVNRTDVYWWAYCT